MKVKYVSGITPNTFGIIDKSSTLEEEYVYTTCSDSEWAARMREYGEKVVEGCLKTTFYVDGKPFSNKGDALKWAENILPEASDYGCSIEIEVETVFLRPEGGNTDFTHMEQLRR